MSGVSGYRYVDEREHLFTDQGQRLFLKMRDQVKALVGRSGAVTLDAACHLPSGIGAASNWEMMACVDRMVEIGELVELQGVGTDQGKMDRFSIRLFVEPRK